MKLTKQRLKQIIKEELENIQQENKQGIDYSEVSNHEVFKAATEKNDPDAWQEMVHRVAMGKMKDPWQQYDEEGSPLDPYDPAWGPTASEFRR